MATTLLKMVDFSDIEQAGLFSGIWNVKMSLYYFGANKKN